MKIIQIVNSEFPPNTGATIRMYELARKLVERGHSVHMIARGKTSGISEFEGMKVIHIGTGGGSELASRLLYSLKAVRAVRRFGLEDADLVIGWNLFPNLAGHMISRRYGIRHICDMTDFFFDFFKASFPSVIWRPVAAAIEMLECRVMPRKAFRVVGVSDFMKRMLTGRYAIPRNKVKVMNDGMYHDIKPTLSRGEVRKRLGIGDDKVILFLGNMERHDGVDVLLEAFKEIREKRKAKLVFVGGGRGYFREFRRRAEASGLARDITFTGYVSWEDALNHIQIADVGVIPFRKRMATDNVFTFKFFEYVALGVPLVCTDIETLAGLMKSKKSGVVVEPDDSRSLAGGINRVLDDRDKFIPKGNDFREFWWENIMDRYSRFLESLS